MELEGKETEGGCVPARALCVKEENGCELDGQPTVRIPELRVEVVKEEPPCEGRIRDSVSEALSGLYTDHEVKEELVLGPENLQRPNNVNAAPHQGAPASLQLRECSVTLQRMSDDLAWLSTAPGTIRAEHTAINKNDLHRNTSELPVIESRLANTVRVTSPLPPQLRVRLKRLPEAVLARTHASAEHVETSELPRRRIRDVLNSLFEESDIEDATEEDCASETHDTIYQRSDRDARVEDCETLRDSDLEKVKDRVEYEKDFCAICNRKFPSSIIMKHLLYHIYVPTSEDYEEDSVASVEHNDHSSEDNVSVDETSSSDGEGPTGATLATQNGVEKETYSCEVCNKKVNTLYSLHEHKRIHSGEKPYLCDVCGREFRVSTSLSRHYRIHQRLKPYSCDICKKKFRQSTALTQHKQTHAREKPFSCELCGSKFKYLRSFNNHKLIHTGERPHECQTCGRKFRQLASLNRHITLMHSQPMHSCKICGKEVRKTDVKLHSQYHSNNIAHRCEICEKGFTKIETLKDHLMIHSGEKPFSCEICKEKFRHSISLKRHVAIHTGEQRFSSDLLKIHRKKQSKEQLSCTVCKREFTQLKYLKIHKRTHLRETTCQICNKVFSNLKYLKQHSQIHQKPYGCEICKKRFRDIYYLKSHKRTHTGEKPYTCDICQKKFTVSSSLNVHKRDQHFQQVKNKYRKFPCEICEKIFTQRSSLRRHKKNHQNEQACQICGKMVAQSNMKIHERFHKVDKRLACGICEKGFLNLRGLKEHLLFHTGQKPFSCNMCPKRFVTKRLLVRHKKSHANTRSVTGVTETERELESPVPSSEPRPLSPKSMFLELIRNKSVP